MLVRKYGVQLSSLVEEDLELVRNWRNSEFVNSQMLYQEYIETETQKKWYQSIQENSIYLMIENRAEKVGLINIKNIDLKERSGEAGIFIGNEKYRNTMFPICAILAMMDMAFFTIMLKSLTAKVKKGNEIALDMNLELGYRVAAEFDDFFELKVTAGEYERKTAQLKDKILKLTTREVFMEFTKSEKSYYLLS